MVSTLDPVHGGPDQTVWAAIRTPPGAGGPVLISERLTLLPLTAVAVGALLAGDRQSAEESTGALFPQPPAPPVLGHPAPGRPAPGRPVLGPPTLAPPMLAAADLARMATRLAARPEDLGWWAWLAIDRTTGAAVGTPALGGPPDDDGSVEFGYTTYPQYAGRGYASEGGRLLLDWVFQDPRVQRVLAVIPPGDAASVIVARRLGMSVIGHALDDEVGELLLLQRTRTDPRPGANRWL